MPSLPPLVVVPKKWNSDHVSVLNPWPSCPRKVVDYSTRVFHCRSCLNMFVDGVTVVCDHGVSSAHDHGTLLLAVEIFSYVKTFFCPIHCTDAVRLSENALQHQISKTTTFHVHTLFGISRSLSGYHTFLYRNYPRTPTTLNVLISRFIDEGERDLEILEKEILSRHGSFISKSYNLGHTDFPSPPSPGSNVDVSSKESLVPQRLQEVTSNWGE